MKFRLATCGVVALVLAYGASAEAQFRVENPLPPAEQYRVEPRPRSLGDFEPTCWWQQTSPRSHFTRSLVCSLLTEHGRVTLSDRTLIRTTGDQREERTLTDDAEVLDAYRSHFGIVLDRLPPSPTP